MPFSSVVHSASELAIVFMLAPTNDSQIVVTALAGDA